MKAKTFLILKLNQEVGKLIFDNSFGDLKIIIKTEYKSAIIRLIKTIIYRGEFNSEFDEQNLIIKMASEFLIKCIKQELFLYLNLLVKEDI